MSRAPEHSWAVRVLSSIDQIDRAAWQACAGENHPFVAYDYLAALEHSGSATADTGWLGQHLVLEDDQGAALGVMPVYGKDHSYGEYVFDWAWADAYHRAGGQYYPKLVSAVPFAPVTGPRALVPDTASDAPERRRALYAGLTALAERLRVSSAHVNFCPDQDRAVATDFGYLHRMGQQYHWTNDGYDDFDDFLSTLSSRKRKTIRGERRKAQAHGLDLRALSGDDIKPHHWDAFYRFYRLTSERKWGEAYLTRAFFDLLGQSMADQVVLMMGFQDDIPVCGALNMLGSDALYGRNWGATVNLPFLHFEVCYYMAIDIAIERGLKTVEAGAQGEHKIFRGYLPTPTHSLHWIRDSRFETAIADFLDRERDATSASIDALARYAPFRKGERQQAEQRLSDTSAQDMVD